MNFARNSSGHICSLVGELLSCWQEHLVHLNLEHAILSFKRAAMTSTRAYRRFVVLVTEAVVDSWLMDVLEYAVRGDYCKNSNKRSLC